ncbi:MAG: ABC transporter substrate-binding protein [Dehalococcoidia bacterium]
MQFTTDKELEVTLTNHRRRSVQAMGIILSVIAFIGFATPHVSADAGEDPASNEIVIGALLSLTGGWSTLGRASEAALMIAAEDLNTQLKSVGSPTRVRVVVEDTKLEPALALEAAQSLAAQGVRVIVGPQSSSEVAALAPWAEATGVVLISQGSTASALSLPNDSIIRLVPDDVREAEALVALLGEDHRSVLVPIWRGDVGNDGLHASTTRLFEQAGGTVTAGVRYDANTTDFAATLAALREQVEEQVARHGTSATAVYLAGFDEIAELFALAGNDPVLSSVSWYGSDGVALSEALPKNAAAAQFAAAVGFPAPLVGVEERLRDRWQPIADQILAMTGITADAFSLVAYDAGRLAALAQIFAAGGDITAGLRDVVIGMANQFNGISGPTTLNAAGDRETGSFDFWAIREIDGTFQWTRVARYEATTGVPGEGQVVR